MEEQNRTAIIYDAQRKMLAADYEMAEIRSLLNELMALEEMDEVIARANTFMAEAELRLSRKNLSESNPEPELSGSDTADEIDGEIEIIEEIVSEEAAISEEAAAEIILEEQKRIIEKLLSKGIVPAQIHQWLDFPMEMIIEICRKMK
ncbi:MAG: hypothetical protein IIZ41_03705 [Lachnospiraceae bacterium]|nr:hypothetical protein [Lachnospiraceae bacterium]MBQ6637192.1 hypothetical protein [Lachnospiraceae bacterium]